MRTAAVILGLVLAPLLLAAAATPDPLLAFPAIPKPKAAPAEELGRLDEIAPGIALAPGRAVVLTGRTLFEQGPSDGLEVLACLEGGKGHEALVKLDTRNGAMINFACLSVLGVKEGQPVPREGGGVPARGTPVRLIVQWRDPDRPDAWLQADASAMVRDRITDKPYPALPFVYTGSRMLTVAETGPDGKLVKVERYMLETTKSLAVNFDEPDALLASPFPGAIDDHRWEVYAGLPSPPPQTPARLVIEKATLPLTLWAVAGGDQLADAEHADTTLDDAALSAALLRAYGAGTTPPLRAVGIVVPGEQPREKDVAIRERILACAAQAPAWVVPVFVLANDKPAD